MVSPRDSGLKRPSLQAWEMVAQRRVALRIPGYGPGVMLFHYHAVEPRGFEPRTSCLPDKRTTEPCSGPMEWRMRDSNPPQQFCKNRMRTPRIPHGIDGCPGRDRTPANRVRVCCASATPPDNVLFVVSHISREDHIDACEGDSQPRDGHQDHLEPTLRNEERAVGSKYDAHPEQVRGDMESCLRLYTPK